jgi:hypothetical protein
MRSAFVKGLKVDSGSVGFDCAIVIDAISWLIVLMLETRLKKEIKYPQL